MGGIKDMLSPPCQNMGGIYHPHPPRIYALGYRPPTQANFYKLLEESLESVSPDMEFILLGDFNTDLTNKNRTCTLVKDLYNFSTMFGLGQLIDSATRITCQC